jgi:hypothetical protein
MTKLTLSVDERVVRRAKRYAARRATSVSRIVEEYLDLLSSPPQTSADEAPPALRLLRGAGRGTNLEDYKAHVLRKYR